MDRISSLTEQLRRRQPNLHEEDFDLLNGGDFLGVNGLDLPKHRVDEYEDESSNISVQDLHLNVTPINAPPKNGFSKNFVEDNDTKIDPNFLCKLDCVVTGQITPVTSISTSPFIFELKKYLADLKLKGPTTCQSYMWPTVSPGKSVCCIGPPKIGKTAGYLLPLISSSIIFRQQQQNLDLDVFIPYSLVLCPHGKAARKIATEAVKWTPGGQRKSLIKIVCIDGPSAINEKSRQANLLNGPDMIITTPSLFLRLIDLKLVSISNCRSLIFDEADELFLIHTYESQKVHTLYIQNNHRERSKSVFAETIRPEEALNSQVVICSESYSQQIRHFLENFMKKPVSIMSDKVEEAVKARIECDVKFCQESKEPSLFDVFDSNFRYEWADKIIICCRDEGESLSVKKLIEQKVYCRVLSTGSKHFNFPEIKRIWNSKGRKVLIIDDEALLSVIATIQIDDAQCLIHYSISEVKGTFASRFILMQSSLKSSQVRCSTTIFVDPSNRKQAHELTLLIKKLGAVVPQELIDLRNTFPRGICHSFAAFGKCPLKSLNCYYDHFCASPIEEPATNGPQVGHQVKFIVTSVRSANMFYARIKSYQAPENVGGPWIDTEYSPEYILKQLQNFEDPDNRLPSSELSLGQVWAIHHISGGKRQVHRVRIEEFRDNINGDSNYIKVYHLDHGFETMVKQTDLMQLPSEWSKYPPLAVKCYSVKYKPNYNEPEWDQSVNQIVLDALCKPEVSYLTGWVSHIYNSCYWVEDVSVYHQLPSLKSHLKAYKLMDLISKTDLYTQMERPKFCKDISSLIAKAGARWKVDKQKKISSSAFISDQHDFYHLIRCGDGPGKVFVRHVKFEKQLDNLEKELGKFSKNPITSFHEGLIALCEYDKMMNRVMIKKINSDVSVEVFFVDHGEIMEVYKKSCYQIEDEFITKLPFQAIAVQLAAEKTNWVADRIYDLTRDPDEVFKKLLVEKLSTDIVPQVHLFVPVSETQSNTVYEDLIHLTQHGVTDPSPLSFNVEKVLQPTDTDSEDEEMGPEEKEARRAFSEVVSQHQKKILESLGMLLPDGGQIPTASSNLPEPAVNGIDDDQDEQQVVPFIGDAAEFDYELPPGLEPLPYDDVDDEDVESDDELELKANDDIDTFFEKLD